ncbi:MAG: hypothetical protein RL410_263 [Actinomycetota bacterium]
MALENLEVTAREHLWMCFTRHGSYSDDAPIPLVVRGEGAYIFDDKGKRYIDGLAGLFTCQVGHGRKELGKAAQEQCDTLEFFPLWTYAHPKAIELADRLAGHAPGDLNRVFFTSGGGEAVESAWKLVKQYYKIIGKPTKYKVISRYLAYHGTTAGALSITGVPGIKQWFEPLVPGAIKAANTNIYRASEELRNNPEEFARHCAQSIEDAILQEGPETVAAVFVEPVQNVGGCFVAPPGYLQMVREICDKYDVLMIADETITGFGRIGAMFAVNRFGVVPDMITTAKGLSSGYVPIGAVIASEKIFAPFASGTNLFSHGFTYSGHAVGAAVACANLDILENEKLPERVAALEPVFKAKLDTLLDIPIVGDVRGAGFFFAIEIVSDKETRESFSDEDSERILRNFLSHRVWELGLYCRADDRGDPVLQLSPPLTFTEEQMDETVAILRQALTEACALV